MASYLLSVQQALPVPSGVRVSPEEVTDWLERVLPEPNVQFQRTSETTLAFRSSFSHWRIGIDPSLSGVGRGEIEVQSGTSGPIIVIRANPPLWYSLIPILPLVVFFGWTQATEVLRWGVGLGGVILGGILLSFAWGGLHYFLSSTVALSRRWPRIAPAAGPPDHGGRLTRA